MIALNELLDNVNHYQDMYNKIRYKTNLNYFIEKETERKKLQLEFEHLRANCNKQCNILAKMKKNGEDFSDIFNEILTDEKILDDMQIRLDKYNNQINKELKKLPNVPDVFLDKKIYIVKNSTGDLSISTFNEYIDRLNQYLSINFDSKFNFVAKNTFKNEVSYLGSIKNQIYEESNAFQEILLSNNSVFLAPEFAINNLLSAIINFTSNISQNLYKVKTTSTSKSSSAEFIAKINDNLRIKISLKREYLTRLYNLKYKNKSIDMTKFLNQINIQKK